MSKSILTFKGICMNFLLEFKKNILSHPVTSKQPHKIVQIHMGHPVCIKDTKIAAIIGCLFDPGYWLECCLACPYGCLQEGGQDFYGQALICHYQSHLGDLGTYYYVHMKNTRDRLIYLPFGYLSAPSSRLVQFSNFFRMNPTPSPLP